MLPDNHIYLSGKPREFFIRKLSEIENDSNDQPAAKIRGNEFSLHLDEATTSTSNKDAYLICFVRFVDNDGSIVIDQHFASPF